MCSVNTYFEDYICQYLAVTPNHQATFATCYSTVQNEVFLPSGKGVPFTFASYDPKSARGRLYTDTPRNLLTSKQVKDLNIGVHSNIPLVLLL